MKTIIAFLMLSNLCISNCLSQQTFKYVEVWVNDEPSQKLETDAKLTYHIHNGEMYYLLETDGDFWEFKVQRAEYHPQGNKLYVDSYGSYLMVFKNSLGLYLKTENNTYKYFFYNDKTKRV